MSRRHVASKREILPDPKYGDRTVAKFINMVMSRGKKAVAEKIVYGALSEVVLALRDAGLRDRVSHRRILQTLLRRHRARE